MNRSYSIIVAFALLSVATAGNAIAQTACENGFAGNFGCNEIDLAAHLPVSVLDSSAGARMNDVWGWTDSTTNRNYILAGTTSSTVFVDATNPLTPEILGILPTQTGPSVWRDMKVYADHAFVVSERNGNHGMQVFDLRRLRDVQGAAVIFNPDAVYDGIASAHNIVINEESGFAFIVGASGGGNTCNGGLHMVDISNPQSPTFAGCFADDGYTHDAQCVIYRGPDSDYSGKEICFAANEDTVTLVDVTDKTAPQTIASTGYPQSGYVHQGWLTEDHRYFIQNDETDELIFKGNTRMMIWDVADLDDPELVHIYEGSTTAVDHNLYIVGNLVFASNYNAGLRLIDISDVAQPVEIGYFDTFPPDDLPTFQGAWSNYPFFSNGTVAVTSIYHGLFILRPTLTALPVDIEETFVNLANEGVQMSWQTRYEIGNQGFTVEEMLPHGGSRDLGFLPGTGDSVEPVSYTFLIEDLDPGPHSFRLRMETSGGIPFYSQPVDLIVPAAEGAFLSTPYPNPVTQRSNFTVFVEDSQTLDVGLYNALGQRLQDIYRGTADAGEHVLLNIDGTTLAGGTYYILAKGESFSTATQFVVIN